MRAEKYYPVKFQNPAVDGGHDRFMVVAYTEGYPLKQALISYKHGYPHLILDENQQSKPFDTKMEAEAECRRLGDLANQDNPERVNADQVFPPGEANRFLETGKPGATPPDGTLELPG